MADILNIVGEPIFDDRIVKFEFHTYNPYANTTFGHSDEIRIPIQQQDLYTLPCESFLYIEGRLTVKKKDDETPTTLGNNCIAFMFDEIRYELNSVEIDRNRNVGITSTLKNYVSLTYDKSLIALNAGWNSRSDITEGYFNFCVPLNMLLGFCEDYKRVIVNARHELILIRARNDNNCILGNSATEPEVELIKVQWRMPHVMLNEITKLSMLRALESGRYLSMSFRSWDLYEYPLLQSTTKHTWAVKTATQLEKPRYVIFALQTGRKNIMSQDASVFDDCKLSNVKLYLNSEFYPYGDLNLDFDQKRYALLFDMYARFRKAYYGIDCFETLLNVLSFIEKGPFAVIDCSRQNESVKSATVDVRIEFDCKENVPANTTAYCLIIHDRVIEYCPLSNVVRKIM
ncbi:PREDICTED: uncharacterized protein LOC108781541 [Cyphomyrmex costatus]|uniref:Double jelly roll-like domain-containing protein n=2 Tax=Cyphomyrmex costatus TaxID=456900 RepID=A0A151IGD7_9HYME|nr:PREDICTED: uncharacterized protein LOC108776169 [Cyphomyrmex costatus]XP_018400176.1 PREDICTED: uncharacterized protein LOC108771189 [Cyphomyrmex costatus]XP_018405037.1 PREDICTED: uncharacterized protein LOC108781541 [Cyphomyrmex costatus]KYN00123.1 hypothetical protein ALC62_09114 [Cyphomyrmex costatus]